MLSQLWVTSQEHATRWRTWTKYALIFFLRFVLQCTLWNSLWICKKMTNTWTRTKLPMNLIGICAPLRMCYGENPGGLQQWILKLAKYSSFLWVLVPCLICNENVQLSGYLVLFIFLLFLLLVIPSHPGYWHNIIPWGETGPRRDNQTWRNIFRDTFPVFWIKTKT